MLFSNTSFIEATFSHIRSLGGCDAATFKTQLASHHMRSCMKAFVDHSASYSQHEFLSEQEIDDGNFDGVALGGAKV
jgi:hypothetical protein